MRAALIMTTALAALALAACDRHGQPNADLKAAGAEAKAAAVDVGKAVDSSVPAIKDAGRKVGDDLKHVGDEAAPDIKAAGRDIRNAAHKAGDDLKDAGRKAKDSVQDKDS